jgi:hypothetical protein
MPGDASQVVYAIGRIGPSGLNLLGTGFAVGEHNIATAYHVVGPDDRDLAVVVPRVSSLSDYQDTSDTSIQTIPLTLAAADPVRDLCVLETPPDTTIRLAHVLSSADKAPPGTPVVTFGFPHAPHGRMVLTQQATQVGARVLIESQNLKSKHIVLNTQAREGQSGGPVFVANSNEVVAVLIGSYAPGGGGQISLGGVDPATLHQTTHAISAEYLQGMV